MREYPKHPELFATFKPLHVGGGMEVTGGEPLYDTLDFPAHVQEGGEHATLTFFQNPIGTSLCGGAPRTYLDTNMHLAGQLPRPVYFVVVGIAVECASRALRSQGELEWIIGSKTYYRYGPLDLFRRYLSFTRLDYPDGNDYSNNYVPCRFDPPLTLVASQNFAVMIRWPVAALRTVKKSVRVRVELCGWRYRPVA